MKTYTDKVIFALKETNCRYLHDDIVRQLVSNNFTGKDCKRIIKSSNDSKEVARIVFDVIVSKYLNLFWIESTIESFYDEIQSFSGRRLYWDHDSGFESMLDCCADSHHGIHIPDVVFSHFGIDTEKIYYNEQENYIHEDLEIFSDIIISRIVKRINIPIGVSIFYDFNPDTSDYGLFAYIDIDMLENNLEIELYEEKESY